MLVWHPQDLYYFMEIKDQSNKLPSIFVYTTFYVSFSPLDGMARCLHLDKNSVNRPLRILTVRSNYLWGIEKSAMKHDRLCPGVHMNMSNMTQDILVKVLAYLYVVFMLVKRQSIQQINKWNFTMNMRFWFPITVYKYVARIDMEILSP